MTDPESIDGYLKCLSRVLGISKGARDRLLEEVEDHLREAAAEAVASGVPPALAERQAVSRFGSVTTIADRAALAEAVGRGRRRIRRILVTHVVGAVVVITAWAALLATAHGPTTVVLGSCVIAFLSVIVVYYLRLARWGLSPQVSLEATLDRQARTWLRHARSFRYRLLLAPLLFVASWQRHVNQHAHAAPMVVTIPVLVLIWTAAWYYMRVRRSRAEKKVAELAA
jgi:hypothetical protein